MVLDSYCRFVITAAKALQIDIGGRYNNYHNRENRTCHIHACDVLPMVYLPGWLYQTESRNSLSSSLLISIRSTACSMKSEHIADSCRYVAITITYIQTPGTANSVSAGEKDHRYNSRRLSRVHPEESSRGGHHERLPGTQAY